MAKLLNAFSANMLEKLPATVTFSELTLEEAREWLADGFESAIGHSATAQVLSERLGLPVKTQRVNVTLLPGTFALLAQVSLPRLNEGEVLTTEQVAVAPVRFIKVEVWPWPDYPPV